MNLKGELSDGLYFTIQFMGADYNHPLLPGLHWHRTGDVNKIAKKFFQSQS